jgi:hypothetical protein
MAPTRELAKQVAADFELTALTLKTITIYGGAPYRCVALVCVYAICMLAYIYMQRIQFRASVARC